MGFEDGVSTIENLLIEGCQVHADTLAIVVNSCVAMKVFTYRSAKLYYLWREPGCERDLSVLRVALSKHATLKRLNVYKTGNMPAFKTWGPLVGLVKLSNLESAALD